jgi:hypothetical protein
MLSVIVIKWSDELSARSVVPWSNTAQANLTKLKFLQVLISHFSQRPSDC